MSNNKPIRVLHLLKNFDIGGVETSNIKLGNYLVDKVEFWGIAGIKGLYLNADIIEKKISVFPNLKNFYNPFNWFFNFLFLFRLIKSKKINILHYHFRIHLPYIYLIKIIFHKIKIIYTHHSTFKDKLVNFIYADYFVAISDYQYQNLGKNVFFKSNASIITNGVFLNNSLHKINRPLSNLGYVGRFDKPKGLDFLIHCFNENSETLKPFKLIIRGKGELDDKIKKIIDNIKNIIMDGPKISITEIYKDIGILIVPSSVKTNAVETFPNIVMLEAMSLYIPVICPNNIKLSDKFVNNYNLITYESDNSKDLVTKLIYLNSNPSYVQKITNNAYNTIVKYFSFERFGDRVFAIYNKVLNP